MKRRITANKDRQLKDIHIHVKEDIYPLAKYTRTIVAGIALALFSGASAFLLTPQKRIAWFLIEPIHTPNSRGTATESTSYYKTLEDSIGSLLSSIHVKKLHKDTETADVSVESPQLELYRLRLTSKKKITINDEQAKNIVNELNTLISRANSVRESRRIATEHQNELLLKREFELWKKRSMILDRNGNSSFFTEAARGLRAGKRPKSTELADGSAISYLYLQRLSDITHRNNNSEAIRKFTIDYIRMRAVEKFILDDIASINRENTDHDTAQSKKDLAIPKFQPYRNDATENVLVHHTSSYSRSAFIYALLASFLSCIAYFAIFLTLKAHK